MISAEHRGSVEHLIREVASAAGVPDGAIIGDAVLTLEAVNEYGAVEEYVVHPGRLTEQTVRMLERAQRSVTRACRPRD